MVMINNVIITNDVKIKSSFDSIYVDLTNYARNNIPNYKTITEIPKENMDYINSVKYAVKCEYMFSNCEKLTTMDLSHFDTSKVTDMGYMFTNIRSLTTIDLSNFDTSNVIIMGYMFSWCIKLTTLNLSNFDTSKVTIMNSMFSGSESLTTLNLSNFNTSNVTYMSYMFSNCTSLSTLNLSNWDTSKVTTMEAMFKSCGSLTTIKGTLDLSSCTNVKDMFRYADNLKGLHLKNVPRSLLDTDGSLKGAGGTLNETYIIDNILEDK